MGLYKNKLNIFLFSSGILIACVVLIFYFFFKPVFIYYVKEQIKRQSGADSVSIRDCDLKFLYFVDFKDIAVHKQKDFDISVKEFSLQFNPWLMLTGAAPDRFIDVLRLSELVVSASSCNLTNGSFIIDRNLPGNMSIDKIQCGNWVVERIKSPIIIDKKQVLFKEITGQALNGKIEGAVNMTMEIQPQYSATINFIDLDLADFADAFKLNERLSIQGFLTGSLLLTGKGGVVRILNGNLSSGSQGGSIIIKDTQFLDSLGGQSQQSSQLLMESLKNYRYNKGVVRLTLDQGVVLLEVNLNGDTGKRNFEIRLHNFI